MEVQELKRFNHRKIAKALKASEPTDDLLKRIPATKLTMLLDILEPTLSEQQVSADKGRITIVVWNMNHTKGSDWLVKEYTPLIRVSAEKISQTEVIDNTLSAISEFLKDEYQAGNLKPTQKATSDTKTPFSNVKITPVEDMSARHIEFDGVDIALRDLDWKAFYKVMTSDGENTYKHTFDNSAGDKCSVRFKNQVVVADKTIRVVEDKSDLRAFRSRLTTAQAELGKYVLRTKSFAVNNTKPSAILIPPNKSGRIRARDYIEFTKRISALSCVTVGVTRKTSKNTEYGFSASPVSAVGGLWKTHKTVDGKSIKLDQPYLKRIDNVMIATGIAKPDASRAVLSSIAIENSSNIRNPLAQHLNQLMWDYASRDQQMVSGGHPVVISLGAILRQLGKDNNESYRRASETKEVLRNALDALVAEGDCERWSVRDMEYEDVSLRQPRIAFILLPNQSVASSYRNPIKDDDKKLKGYLKRLVQQYSRSVIAEELGCSVDDLDAVFNHEIKVADIGEEPYKNLLFKYRKSEPKLVKVTK